MSDIIRLLPDNIANQIAAGEVIQRPASVAKELLENALDAGATQITLIIKDAGKTLIQVIDNGKGMSSTDARMSFERHATSKIASADDLFAIRTMGFRGEALASIAAIAQVKLLSRRKDDSVGSLISIIASDVEKQEPCAIPDGTQVEVKNLFFNVPARRKFLKTDSVEMRFILDEFYRIALAKPSVSLKLINNDKEQFNLPKAGLRQRIVNVLGNKTNENWIKLEEVLDSIKISGFVGKPEAAKKSKADQYFFVNGRFIKSGYLHHAVMSAYQELIQDRMHPPYVIYFDMDPSSIDINVHPTKQEIKFDDEKLIYSYLRVAVRHALGQYALTPMLDFDQEHSVSGWLDQPATKTTHSGSDVITKSSKLNQSNFQPEFRKENVPANWRDLYENSDESFTLPQSETADNGNFQINGQADPQELFTPDPGKRPYQLHNRYIVNQIKSGFIIVDQQRAHQRILFERFTEKLKDQTKTTQPLLFPEQFDLETKQSLLLDELLDLLTDIGFDIRSLGHHTYLIYGIPAMVGNQSSYTKIVEEILAGFSEHEDLELGNKDRIALSMARSASIRKGDVLNPDEMNALIDQLFACEMPYATPTGKNCFITFELDQIIQQFG